MSESEFSMEESIQESGEETDEFGSTSKLEGQELEGSYKAGSDHSGEFQEESMSVSHDVPHTSSVPASSRFVPTAPRVGIGMKGSTSDMASVASGSFHQDPSGTRDPEASSHRMSGSRTSDAFLRVTPPPGTSTRPRRLASVSVSYKSDTDKEGSDEADSDKEDTDEEDSDEGDSDKEGSAKQSSGMEGSDHDQVSGKESSEEDVSDENSDHEASQEESYEDEDFPDDSVEVGDSVHAKSLERFSLLFLACYQHSTKARS